jgi:hypothetical protein
MANVKRSARFGGVLWGGVLLVVGTWLLLDELGWDMPNIGAMWPVFPFMFGAAFLVSFFVGDRSDPGLVWPATFGVLLGIFFFLFSLEILDWEEMGVLWPVFPLMVGIAFFATWLAGGCRDSGILVPGTVTLLVGGIGLALTQRLLVWDDVRLYWPLALVAIGGSMVFRSLRSPR